MDGHPALRQTSTAHQVAINGAGSAVANDGGRQARYARRYTASPSIATDPTVVESGRLVRVLKHDELTPVLAYIVAIAEPGDAVALIRQKVAAPNDHVIDVGRVSGALIRSLNLPPGDFVVAARRRPADTGSSAG